MYRLGVEESLIVRQQYPIGGIDEAAIARVVLNVDGMHAHGFGKARHDGNQVHITVGDVEGEDAVWLQMSEVGLKAFLSQQVYGDGITAEGIDGENVESLTLTGAELALKHDACIPREDLDICSSRDCIRQETKEFPRPLHHQGIEFVEAYVVRDAPSRLTT